MRVLVVCSANLCRSPMAEVLLRHLAAARGLSLEVASAGILGIEGSEAVEPAIAVCRQRGLDLRGFRSRGVTPEVLLSADLVLVMERRHLRTLEALAPQRAGALRLLGSFDPLPGAEPEIADPVAGTRAGFEACLARLERCLEAFLDSLVAG